MHTDPPPPSQAFMAPENLPFGVSKHDPSSQADCPEPIHLRVYILRCPHLGLRAEAALTLLMARITAYRNFTKNVVCSRLPLCALCNIDMQRNV